MPSLFLRHMRTIEHDTDHISSSIVIERPADILFDLWRKPETLPILMSHVAQIDILNATDSRWRMKAPFGQYIEWQARIVEEQPGEFIYWRSLQGARIPNEGRLSFGPAPQVNGTAVTLMIRFDPPGGFLGRKISQVFQLLPKEMLSNTLQRFKTLAETGEILPSPDTDHQ